MKPFDILARINNLIFLVFMPAIIVISTFVYWRVVAEPEIRASTELYSSLWVESNVYRIATTLDSLIPGSHDLSVQQVKILLDKMLLFEEPKTGIHFLLGLKLKLDYNVIKVRQGELDIISGEPSCDECFIKKMPIFSQSAGTLMGIATFYNNSEFYRRLKDDMKSKHIILAGAIFAFHIAVWLILTVKTRSLGKAEKYIREQHAKLASAERLRSMGEMATGIAHELSQPLAVINLLTDDIKRKSDEKHNKILKKFLDKIEGQVNRAGDIIENMQNFMRIIKENTKPTDIRTPISSALDFFNERFRSHTVIFTTSLPDDPPEVMVIPEYFQQIVVNLLTNAYHAVEKKAEKAGTEYRKKVDIRLFRDQIHDQEKEILVLELQDNGTGMGKEVRNRCLDPFYTTKDVGKGTGLGLHIINRIVKEFKMTMEIDSIEGHGTTFRIFMPIA